MPFRVKHFCSSKDLNLKSEKTTGGTRVPPQKGDSHPESGF
jgi:hypothetical protein